MSKLIKRLSVLLLCVTMIMGDSAIQGFAAEVQEEQVIISEDTNITELTQEDDSEESIELETEIEDSENADVSDEEEIVDTEETADSETTDTEIIDEESDLEEVEEEIEIATEAFNDAAYSFSYTVKNGGAIITNLEGEVSGDLIIPESIDGYTVTGIGDYAFQQGNFTGSLLLPNSITSIGICAFEGCDFTGSLIIPDSVTSIGSYAFNACKSFDGSLTIGRNVKTIGDAAFASCSGFIGSLTIPDSVTSIGKNAFNSCSGFKQGLIIGNNVKEISQSAFYSCSGFTGNLIIPDSVTSIGLYAFTWCSGFTGSLTLGNNVKTIDDYAFEGCGFYGDLTIPYNVETIGNMAFFGCKNLNGKLTITNNATNINSSAFIGCNFNSNPSGNTPKKIYTLIFSKNGGVGTTISSLKVPEGSSFTLPSGSNYTKVGYDFVGWCLSNSGSGKIYEASSKMSTSELPAVSTTIYAVWKPKTFAVSYVLYGGEMKAENPSTVEYGKTVKLNAPVKPGITFVGWYLDPLFKIKVTSIDGKKLKDYILYAKWGGPATYTISYVNPKGTTAAKGNPTKYKITDETYELKSPTRKGYIFAGWYTEAEYVNRVDTIVKGSYGNLKLYSKWVAIKYYIDYNGNGATSGYTAPTEHVYDVAMSVAENGFQKIGYTFDSWNKNEKGNSTAYKLGAAVKSLSYTEGEHLTLYAKWKPNAYYVYYEGNGSTSGKMSSSSKFTYDATSTIAKCAYKKTGYVFDSWNTKADGSGQRYEASKKGIYNLTTVGNGAVILYAQWKPVNYTVDFKCTSYSILPMAESISMTYDKEVYLPVAAGKPSPNLTFVGWNTNVGATGIFYPTGQPVKNLTASSKITLYAQYSYNVNIDANGGTGDVSPMNLTFGKSQVLEQKNISKVGYTFSGWKAIVNGKEVAYKANQSVKNLYNKDNSEVTLVAQWKPIVYTAVFCKNYGSTPLAAVCSAEVVTYNSEFSLPDASKAKRTGYILTGWKDSIGNDYAIGEKLKNVTDSAGRIYYYAQWVEDVKATSIELSTTNVTLNLSSGATDISTLVGVVVKPENAYNKAIEWTIYGTSSVATVKNNIITPLKEGEVKFVACTMDGSNIRSALVTCKIEKVTKVVFPLDTKYEWTCSTYPGHGSAYKSAYSSLDINVKDGRTEGYAVYAMAGGVVVSGPDDNGQIVIKHSTPLITINGVEYTSWYSVYAHMKDISVKIGDIVEAGQQIGLTSSVAGPGINVTGPHLHINIMSAEDGKQWYQNDDIKYAISPYYVYGFVNLDGSDMSYLKCDREGVTVTEALINHVPAK